MRRRDGDRDAAATESRRRHGLRAFPLLAALALGLALAGCDRCGDFDWQGHPGACHTHPAPN
jgi:hypothetical protein